MPIAVPSTSARFSDAEAWPSCPGRALRSIISDSGAYASPMPRPATVQAARPTTTGTARLQHQNHAGDGGQDDQQPGAYQAPSFPGAAEPRLHRQARAVQATVAPVTAIPATTRLRWRTAVSARVT